LAVGTLNPYAAGLVGYRFDLISGAKFEEAWELLRAGDRAALAIPERPSTITETAALSDEDLAHGRAEHRLDRISPQFVDGADVVSARRSLACRVRTDLV
jgi:hypothetical protein